MSNIFNYNNNFIITFDDIFIFDVVFYKLKACLKVKLDCNKRCFAKNEHYLPSKQKLRFIFIVNVNVNSYVE